MLILRLAGLVDKKLTIPILGSLTIRSILGSAPYRASLAPTGFGIDTITEGGAGRRQLPIQEIRCARP